jgi:PAS domain S-box-containing protein
LAALVLASVGCSIAALQVAPGLGFSFGVLALTFPFLVMWGAARFELLGASLVIPCIALVTVSGTGYGLGPFVEGTPLRNAALLQSFLFVLAVSSLSVAALTVERARLIRQRAERDAQRASEERFQEIADTANEGVWMLDSRLLTCFVNRRLAQMLGYSVEQMLGQPIISFVFEEDAAPRLAGLERRQRGPSEQFDARFRKKDGSELWGRISTAGSFDSAGCFTGVLAMISDVTEQKLREAEGRATRREILLLTRAVEQTADSVVVTDKRGVIEYVNPAFEATTGYAREEAVGRTPAILKSGHHDAGFYREMWEELLNGRTFRGTLINRKKSGQLYWAEQTITPIKDDEGEVTHFVSVLKDVTELRREHEHEVQLRLARDVQQRFYQAPIALPGLDLAAVSYPASETGGDYFDFIPAAEGSVYVAIGDASGHGLGAALVMTLTRAYVRSFAGLDLDVGEILTRLNGMLCRDLEGNRFVTMLLARVDARTRILRYANAGHVPGLVVSPGEGVQSVMAATGPPLGLFAGSSFSACELTLEPREVALLITDGVTESTRADDEQFGHDRVLDFAVAHAERPARSIAEDLCGAARGFAAGAPQLDDVTAVVVKATRADGAATTAAASPAFPGWLREGPGP